ncbi:hypothetical protein [Nostoc sp. UHCC 0251]|uniref:hypothetical protein n=1 Tax=Nostoc sp. UHCC 0251 TaxID=3110240 RepID=UPI002B1EE3F8|nr:hypothetical protein [Nostoc sp. UHCC 0251]MEA5626395.1 hypothetical protein [Nostoc sp. UHCC 0251]
MDFNQIEKVFDIASKLIQSSEKNPKLTVYHLIYHNAGLTHVELEQTLVLLKETDLISFTAKVFNDVDPIYLTHKGLQKYLQLRQAREQSN